MPSCPTLPLPRADRLLAFAALALLALPARAGEVYAKPPSPAGGVNQSSWVAPDGSDSDMYAWEDFTLPVTQAITEVRWRGGYALGAPFGKVSEFRISIFPSNITGFEPLITALPEDEEGEAWLLNVHTGNNAGETPVGVVGGVALYDYRCVLPQPFVATAGVKYWIRLQASQPVYPDWGPTTGTGGNGAHFRYVTGYHMFQSAPHDLSFALHARWEDLGAGLAGTAGVPKLSGSGTLAAGAPGTLTLASARANAPVTLVFGTTPLGAPFKGGTLVPVPLLIVALASDAAGQVSLPFVMPAGVPPATALLFQAWIVDPAAPHGLSASNGLEGSVP